MNTPVSFTNARPGDRIQRAGMSREAVGVVYHPTGQPAPAIVRERGLTYPLRVTNVSTEALPVDTDRQFLFIQNNDPVGSVTVSFGGGGAVLGVGFNLAAGGGGILLDNHVPTARMFVVGSIAANANVTMVVG